MQKIGSCGRVHSKHISVKKNCEISSNIICNIVNNIKINDIIAIAYLGKKGLHERGA